MVVLWGSPASALFGFGPTTFQEAYSKGAKARIEFRVVDDTGCPVKGANVNVFFDMADRSKGRRVIEQTDTNGVCIAEEKTKGVLEIEVSREGYYRSGDLISFINMGHEHDVKNPVMLNMASRRCPGGGVLNGARAQEETLFRRSNLCVSLYQFDEYHANLLGVPLGKGRYPMEYGTAGIYSGRVMFDIRL